MKADAPVTDPALRCTIEFFIVVVGARREFVVDAFIDVASSFLAPADKQLIC